MHLHAISIQVANLVRLFFVGPHFQHYLDITAISFILIKPVHAATEGGTNDQ
jgi:hypothetical protein